MTEVALWRRLAAEFLGSAFLAALVIGSGIAAQRLSPGDTGLELLENAAATAAGLFAIILMFGPVSGGHFNPVVSFVDAAFRGVSWRDAAAYLPAQVAGCISRRDRRQPDVRPARSQHLGQAPGHGWAFPVGDHRDPWTDARDLRAGEVGQKQGHSRPLSARISARPTSSPRRLASPTRRSPSAGYSPIPSPGSPHRRLRPSSPPRSSAASSRSGLSGFSIRA